MLANRLPGMTEVEALEATAVCLVSGREPFDPRNWRRRPFRDRISVLLLCSSALWL